MNLIGCCLNKVSAKWSSTPSTNDPRQLNIWIRADSWGSIEALENYLYQIVIPNDEYYFQIISKDVGPLYEHIIKECDSRNCFILNFNVPIKRGRFRERHVSIFDSNIIFDSHTISNPSHKYINKNAPEKCKLIIL